MYRYLAIALILYSILAGLRVPLNPGIVRMYPETAMTGQSFKAQFYGYNTFFSKGAGQMRVWLKYDSTHALAGRDIMALNDTILEAVFDMPLHLPEGKASVFLDAILDNPADAVSILPSAVSVRTDSISASAIDTLAWRKQPVSKLHLQSGFSFPYRNVIYESIRNTYFHVPMWFGLMAMCGASVWNSLHLLFTPSEAARSRAKKRFAKLGLSWLFSFFYPGFEKQEHDRRAAAYAAMGLLFGLVGLGTGMVWAHYAWGAAWSNDIKQLSTAVMLLIYVAYFILRSSFDEPEKGARLAAVYNIFAFASIIPLLYIVPRMFASLHPGAEGSPAFGGQDLDNTMRMVFYPAIIGWIMLGTWVARLHFRAKRVEDRLMDMD